MKSILLITASLLFSTASIAQKTTALSTAPIEARELPDYQSIEALNGIEVSLGSASSISKEGVYVEASSAGLLKKIKTLVEGQVLKVFLAPDGDADWRGVKPPEHYKVHIVVADLHSLRIAKGAVVTFESTFSNTGTQALTVDLLSGGKVLGDVSLNALNITLSGGAKAIIGGTASRLNVRAVEGSAFLSPKLESQECTAYAASASHIRLAVDKTLDAQSFNEAEIKYTGTPLLKNSYCKDGGKISKATKI